ncbi:MAG: hypothetical protein E6Q34_10055 [Burkholderiaceae bacterium]|nr:MAG: hypothetical protein E6Q34_10055 [Burkholderiaceae bacterium]
MPALAADAKSGQFDPSQHKGPRSGQMSQVYVLGTIHLSEKAKDFSVKNLSLVMDKLAAWKPELIAIEALSGAQCDFLRHYPARYSETVKYYCYDTNPAKAATGLDVPSAVAEADRLLASLPKDASPSQRRRLAAVLLAAGERTSALVQWLYLPESERVQGDGIDEKLHAYLEKYKSSMNEDTQIAAPLAVRLGHQRVYPVDDHTADTAPYSAEDDKAAEAAMMKAWNNPASAKRQAMSGKIEAKLDTPEAVLAMYRAYNQPALGQLIFNSDFGAAMNEGSTKQFGRQYLGFWETRNLRMVANMRDVLGQTPGKRMLAVVGLSHKPYYEAYLNMMHDVKVVYGDALLK